MVCCIPLVLASAASSLQVPVRVARVVAVLLRVVAAVVRVVVARGKAKGKEKEFTWAAHGLRFAAHGHKRARCANAVGFPMSSRNFRRGLALELTGIVKFS